MSNQSEDYELPPVPLLEVPPLPPLLEPPHPFPEGQDVLRAHLCDLRDEFAGWALMGLLCWSPDECEKQYTPDTAALLAYDYAEAMIRERRKRVAADRKN